MIGNALGRMATALRHGRGDLLVQHASPLGWYLVIGRLLQQRMTEPEPILLRVQQAGRHQVAWLASGEN